MSRDKKEKNPKTRKNKLYTILIIVFAVIFLMSALLLIFYLKDYFTARHNNAKLKNMLDEPKTAEDIKSLPPNAKQDFAKLYAINNDFIGWIKLDDTVIDYPVCLSRDNNDYLKTDFYGNYHRLGCVFADYRSTVTRDYQSENIILYGHSAADGSYFNAIRKYKNIDFYKEHRIISFDTMFESGTWVVIGAFAALPYATQSDSFEYFNYIDMDESDFDTYISEVLRRSYFKTDIDVAYGDRLITLSTCDYEYDDTRFVVVARKLRESETEDDFNDSQTAYNANRFVPDFDDREKDLSN